MTRHIADKKHEHGPGRIRNFTQQERESGLHPAITALHVRPKPVLSKDGRRVSEYARIERGQRV